MNKTEQYKTILADIQDRISYLKENSNLPGKRGNLELLEAIVQLGDESFFNECLTYDEITFPTNTPGEFVACCGITGIGKIIANGNDTYFGLLKKYSSDSRWRVREGVAFALQIIGKKDFNRLITEMKKWKNDNLFVRRAIVAGLCEPALLRTKENAGEVLDLLFEITVDIRNVNERKDESFRVLKKGLGYGLSVAIAAWPEKGRELFEQLVKHRDKDILWVLKENLKKNRLIKLDKEWVEQMKAACA
ncbi:MAG: hypothetical protein PVF73_05575 [Bacteroidales bacterium]|jgi:hypothetical protein